jgi:hypothetical protein
MDIITWGLRVFGIDDIPSVDVLKDLDAELQDLCGIRSIRYEGALGHVYYVNNIEDIIAQVVFILSDFYNFAVLRNSNITRKWPILVCNHT